MLDKDGHAWQNICLICEVDLCDVLQFSLFQLDFTSCWLKSKIFYQQIITDNLISYTIG